MDWIDIIIGILLIILGIFLIKIYRDLKKENKTGGLSFKLQTGGIGCIMIGIALIIRAF
ncbi:hypothetical protein SAMN05428642_1233 [Flaviramulus basaltis]|uniref:Uncharacterized protein n=1 Tax=Flaviramulus basaltis TaxID=369401 RepID=A0A1K2IS49_9FLAO|nr:hypothetical protein [Flaviramulus basaltis]SFZ95284.1 hypothetical protein SAMN05428642_1233 [Flaviramulus basaltis]